MRTERSQYGSAINNSRQANDQLIKLELQSEMALKNESNQNNDNNQPDNDEFSGQVCTSRISKNKQ